MTKHTILRPLTGSLSFTALLLFGVMASGQTGSFQPNPSVGPGKIIVHSKFGGQIFGFDIDQNGTEGLLSEALTLNNGNVLATIETFDQATGKIIKVASETETQDNFVTYGVFGKSVGLVEHEHVTGIYVTSRTYDVLNPLEGNKVTSMWTPPIGPDYIIMPDGVTHNQGEPNVAVFAYDNGGTFIPEVFSSNVAANTFGPVAQITDSLNFGSVPPPMAYDSVTNQAIMGGGDGCFDCFPVIGVVDLTTATYNEFTGMGFGFVNGIAVDSADGIFVTTTEDDANVEFYNLGTDTGFKVVLPGSGGNQINSGADVEFDPIHKLFLIAQPVSSSSPTGSTIYVYDTKGNVQETLNGFSFSNSFNVVPTYIALHPSQRSGFVDGPDSGVTELQSFTY